MSGERGRIFVKVLVLGQSNVGKSSLIERYCKDQFTAERRMTIGADFMTKILDNISEESQVVLQIWDTAGQERFTTSALSNAFYRGSDGALLVYDATNEKSAEQLAMWRDEVVSRLDAAGGANFPIVVVANKMDLVPAGAASDTTSHLYSVDQWCKDFGYGHVETSAKDGKGVEAAMLAIASLGLEAKKRAPNSRNSQRISELYTTEKKSSCSSCS